MKSKIVLGFGVLLAVVLSSCASMMYPEKTSSDESLLVIPTEFIQDTGTEHVRSYYLGFSNQSSEKEISSQRYNKIFVKLTSEEDKIIEISSRVTNPDYVGDASSREFDIELPYAAGRIVISDFKIVQNIKRTKANTTTSGYDFVDLTEEEKQILLDDLMANSALISWFE